MSLPKSKRHHLRKRADENRAQLQQMGFDLDILLDALEACETDRDDLKRQIKIERIFMSALANLTSAIGSLTVAVDNITAAISTPPTGVPEADVQNAADAVAVQTARLVAATPVPPPPPAPPAPPTP